MVGDDETLEIHSTVSAGLLLQIVVLFGYALVLSLEFIPSTDPLMFVGFTTLAAYFGALGLMGIWVNGQYTAGDIRYRRLQLWAAICIIHALFPIITISSALITFNNFSNLVYLIPPILLFISSLIVLVYTRKISSE